MFYRGNCATCKGDIRHELKILNISAGTGRHCNGMFLDINNTKQTHMCNWRSMKVEGLENLEKAFVIHL